MDPKPRQRDGGIGDKSLEVIFSECFINHDADEDKRQQRRS